VTRPTTVPRHPILHPRDPVTPKTTGCHRKAELCKPHRRPRGTV
jgi:hypothetical protein